MQSVPGQGLRGQAVLDLIYPTQCVSCDTRLDDEMSLCGACWRQTPFILGLVCDLCGTPLPGDGPADGGDRQGQPADGSRILCDDCMATPRPWQRGRALFSYRDNARRLVLQLKHGDRTDLARPMARWLAGIAAPVVTDDTVVAPVPLHWSRVLVRRYSQSALLARALAHEIGRPYLPDALVRLRRTPLLEGMSRERRFATLSDAIRPHPRRGSALAGRSVLLVDDVMTTGATLTATAEAAHQAGAARVQVLVLARVAKDD